MRLLAAVPLGTNATLTAPIEVSGLTSSPSQQRGLRYSLCFVQGSVTSAPGAAHALTASLVQRATWWMSWRSHWCSTQRTE